MSNHTEFTTTTTTPPPAAPASPPGHDRLAVWAFVVAWLVPLAGAILGHVSNSRRKAAGLARDGLAVAAVVLGWVFTAISALAVVLVVALVGLSSSVDTALNTSPTSSAPAAQAPDTPTQAPAPATDPTGALGTTANVTDSSGNAYSVTAKQVIDPAQPASSYDAPDNGTRFVGVVFSVKVTSGKLDNAGDNCAQLLGSNGQSYDTTVSSIAGYDGTSTLLKLNAGEQQTIAEVFQLPNGVRPATVKWTPDSGMSDSTATWHVTSTTASAARAQAPAPQAAQAAPATGQDLRDIGGGVYAGSVTSTAFARNVVAAWKQDPTAGVKQVYSPVTGQTYAMTYSTMGAGTVIATGGNGAYVQF